MVSTIYRGFFKQDRKLDLSFPTRAYHKTTNIHQRYGENFMVQKYKMYIHT